LRAKPNANPESPNPTTSAETFIPKVPKAVIAPNTRILIFAPPKQENV